jgi:hypothetical protein
MPLQKLRTFSFEARIHVTERPDNFLVTGNGPPCHDANCAMLAFVGEEEGGVKDTITPGDPTAGSAEIVFKRASEACATKTCQRLHPHCLSFRVVPLLCLQVL